MHFPQFALPFVRMAGLALTLAGSPDAAAECYGCDYQNAGGYLFWVGSCVVIQSSYVCSNGTCITSVFACPDGTQSQGTSCTC